MTLQFTRHAKKRWRKRISGVRKLTYDVDNLILVEQYNYRGKLSTTYRTSNFIFLLTSGNMIITILTLKQYLLGQFARLCRKLILKITNQKRSSKVYWAVRNLLYN